MDASRVVTSRIASPQNSNTGGGRGRLIPVKIKPLPPPPPNCVQYFVTWCLFKTEHPPPPPRSNPPLPLFLLPVDLFCSRRDASIASPVSRFCDSFQMKAGEKTKARWIESAVIYTRGKWRIFRHCGSCFLVCGEEGRFAGDSSGVHSECWPSLRDLFIVVVV